MKTIQQALASVLQQESTGLEIMASDKNKVNFLFQGQLHTSYLTLPKTAQFAVLKNLMEYREAYTTLIAEYGHEETVQRMCWCLYGSVDAEIDIDVATGQSHVEVASHCSGCQYSKCFCKQLLAPFTKREQECLMYMREGYTDKEIAQVMNISTATVVTHFTNAVAKVRAITRKNITRAYLLTKLQEAGV